MEMLALRIKLISHTTESGQRPCPPPLGQQKKGWKERGLDGGEGRDSEGEREGTERGSEKERQ